MGGREVGEEVGREGIEIGLLGLTRVGGIANEVGRWDCAQRPWD